jgi:hypothetical protein
MMCWKGNEPASNTYFYIKETPPFSRSMKPFDQTLFILYLEKKSLDKLIIFYCHSFNFTGQTK